MAVGWVWTNNPAAVVTTPKLLPLLGVGSWFLAVALKAPFVAFVGLMLAEIQKFGSKS